MASFSIRPLSSEDDWLSCRERLLDLESRCVANPWAGWEYVHEQWRTFIPEVRCWLVEAPDPDAPGGPLLAAGLWREHVLRRRRFRPRALCSFDHVFFMRTPPFLAQRGREEEACRVMGDALGPLARAARANLMVLLRMDKSASDPWVAELRGRGVFVKRTLWTPAPQMAVSDDIEACLQEKHKRVLRENRRQTRRIEERWGAPPAVVKYDTATLSDGEFAACLDRFEELERRTWQHEWGRESGRVDQALTSSFDRKAFSIWRGRGMLDIYLMTIADQAVAHVVTLRGEGRTWVLVTGYDQEYKDYGVGKLLLLEMMTDRHKAGSRLFEFGGEVLGWKTIWATDQEPVYKIEWALGGWKGRLWRLAQWFKGKEKAADGEAGGGRPEAGGTATDREAGGGRPEAGGTATD